MDQETRFAMTFSESATDMESDLREDGSELRMDFSGDGAGPPGKSAYQTARENGFEGTEEEWLESLRGDPGRTPVKGEDYDDGISPTVRLEAAEDGYWVTITDAQGSHRFYVRDGIPATHKWSGTILYVTSASGTSSADLKGKSGDPGLSAYELAVKNGFGGSEEEWLESLNGDLGLSAYEIAVENGFEGTEAEWLQSLKGPAYTLTEADKAAITAAVVAALPVYDGEVVSA